jgi:hypothetical protein
LRVESAKMSSTPSFNNADLSEEPSPRPRTVSRTWLNAALDSLRVRTMMFYCEDLKSWNIEALNLETLNCPIFGVLLCLCIHPCQKYANAVDLLDLCPF